MILWWSSYILVLLVLVRGECLLCQSSHTSLAICCVGFMDEVLLLIVLSEDPNAVLLVALEPTHDVWCE